MKRLFICGFVLVASVISVVSGCTKNKSDASDTIVVIKRQEGKPLAQIGNSVLTVESLREDFQRRQGQFKGAPNLNTDKARNDYVDNQVLQEAIFLDALKNGTLNHIDLQTDVKKQIVQRRVRDMLEKSQASFVPSEESIKEHYEKNQNLYNRDDAVRVAFISVPFGEKRAKAKEVASIIYKDALERVKNANTRAFSRLAMDHAEKVMAIGSVSIETNETEYLDKAKFEEKFGKDTFIAVKNLESMGDFLPLVTTDKAYVIMMKTGARKALNETLEDAKPKIIKRLGYENRSKQYKEYTERLHKEYNIKVFQEVVAELSKGAQAENKVAELPNSAYAPTLKTEAKDAPKSNQPKSLENPN